VSDASQLSTPLPESVAAPPRDFTEPPPVVTGAVRAVETWGLVAVLALMTVLPTVETVARTIFRSTVPGGAQYVQLLTLWFGFLGALLASGTGRHLSLATGERLPARMRTFARVYSSGVSGGVCALLAYASVRMVQADSAVNSPLPGGVPGWWGELVMPFALGLMALRFARHASERWPGRVAALALAGLCVATGAFDPTSLRLPGAVALLVALLLGAPIFVGMAGLAMLLFFADGTPIASVPVETYRLVASPTLPAIPLLTVAGYILAEGGASHRLLRLAKALVGWLPGGMALIVCLVLAAFTTFTGGSGVTILALGGLVLPMLVEEKYPSGFSTGLVMSSGSLGLLFPPSLPVILYAVVAGAGISDLYLAGFVPGVILVVLVAGLGMTVGVREKAPRQPFRWREAVSSLWDARWELAVPAVVLGALLTGLATLVEAAAIAVVAAFVAESLVWRDIHPVRKMPKVLANAAALTGAVLVLLGVAMGLTSWLVDAEIPSAVMQWTRAHIESRWAFLLALNGVLLVLGSVVEIFSAIVILAPLVVPMAVAYGIDPVHMGVVFLANLELGFLLPPMGLNLLLASTRFNQPLPKLYRWAAPFLLIRAAGLLVVTYVPALTVGVLQWVRAH